MDAFASNQKATADLEVRGYTNGRINRYELSAVGGGAFPFIQYVTIPAASPPS